VWLLIRPSCPAETSAVSRSVSVHRLRPFGGGEQASAINLASAAPSKMRFLVELAERGPGASADRTIRGPRIKPPRFDAIERDLVVATVVELHSALMRHVVRKAEADALLDTCSINRRGKFITCPAHRQHPGHQVFADGLPGTRRERSNRRYDADGRMCRRCRCYAGYQPCGKTSLPAFWRRRDRGCARCDHVR
jgi:hypothetical protein